MKKYRLLKDIPGTRKGSEVKFNESSDIFEIETFFGFTCIPKGAIEEAGQNISDWFEEITEPETYTKQDMINFADQCIQTYKEKKSVKFMYELSVYKPHQPVKEEERKWTDKEVIDFTQYFEESPYTLNDAFARWKYKKEN